MKTALLPAVGRFAMMIAYITIAIKNNEFLVSTIVFIIVFEAYDAWWCHYRVTNYLKGFQDNFEAEKIKKPLNKKTFIELLISVLCYPIFFFE
jgi:hypothetical protein